MGERATLNADMLLRPVEGGTAVAWTITAECGEGWINVPCRYMNLILRGMVEKELDSGLGRLKTLAEQLPNVNFEALNPQFDEIAPQMFVYSPVETVANDPIEISQIEGSAIQDVRNFMNERQLVQAGPMVRVVTEFSLEENRMKFQVGFPFNGPMPLSFRGVQIGETPSGRAMHVLVEGNSANVQAAYAQMNAYMQAHRIAGREGGLPWEVVHQQGAADGTVPTRIEIFMPLQ